MYKVATLSLYEMERIKDLEKELDVVLVAYKVKARKKAHSMS